MMVPYEEATHFHHLFPTFELFQDANEMSLFSLPDSVKNPLIKKSLAGLFHTIEQSLYLAKRRGARVANISMGVNPHTIPPDLVTHSMTHSLIRRDAEALSKRIQNATPDMVIVVAAGNEATDLSSGNSDFPCQIRSGNVLCVGSVNKKGELSADFTNFGQQFIDLFAPGEEQVSTIPRDYDTTSPQPSRAESGTSMAAPNVSHAVARVMIECPKIPARSVIELLKTTADKKVKEGIQVGNRRDMKYPYLVLNQARALAEAKKRCGR
jgi:subtilisin family serine protease